MKFLNDHFIQSFFNFFVIFTCPKIIFLLIKVVLVVLFFLILLPKSQFLGVVSIVSLIFNLGILCLCIVDLKSSKTVIIVHIFNSRQSFNLIVIYQNLEQVISIDLLVFNLLKYDIFILIDQFRISSDDQFQKPINIFRI
jgi:hypothetical protein